MPAKDYYFDTDAKSAGIRDVYVKHIAKILTLSGETPAAAARDAAAAMTIESALAKASMRRAEMRPSALDHPMSIADLQRLAPHFDWSDYFQALETPAFDRLNVAQPEFFRALDQQLESASVDDWKAYLRWNLINTGADLLPMDWQRKTFSSMETCWTGARRTIRDGGSASISR